MTFDKPVTIQKQDETSEEWTDWKALHARVNKATGSTDVSSGADQFNARLIFDLRYIAALENIRYAAQLYRIVYRGHYFRVVDFDDYMEEHQTVRLIGEFYEY